MRISDWSSDVCSSDLADLRDCGDCPCGRPGGTSQCLVQMDRAAGGSHLRHLYAASDHSFLGLSIDDGGRFRIKPGDRHLRAVRLACRLSLRSEEHTSELQSLMRISYAVFCLKKKQKHNNYITQS